MGKGYPVDPNLKGKCWELDVSGSFGQQKPPLTSESIAFLRKKKSLRDESVRVWREEKGGNPTAAAPSPGIFDFLHVVLADLIL